MFFSAAFELVCWVTLRIVAIELLLMVGLGIILIVMVMMCLVTRKEHQRMVFYCNLGFCLPTSVCCDVWFDSHIRTR